MFGACLFMHLSSYCHSRLDSSDVEAGEVSLYLTGTRPTYSVDVGADAISVPSDLNLCGTVYGILYVDFASDLNPNERVKYNNFASPLICLSCDSSGLSLLSRYFYFYLLIILFRTSPNKRFPDPYNTYLDNDISTV